MFTAAHSRQQVRLELGDIGLHIGFSFYASCRVSGSSRVR